jgi:hypothetical protein
MISKALSSKIRCFEQGGSFKDVPTSPKGLQLSHLFFVDDNLIFCRATMQDWQKLTEILDGHEKVSDKS